MKIRSRHFMPARRIPRGLLIALLSCALLFLLAGCGFPGMVSTSAQLPMVDRAATPPALPPIRFPQDEGAHNNLTEWWYYTGHMQATDAAGQQRMYGFELVTFQVLRSSFSPTYVSHFAISDITHDSFHYDQRRITQPVATSTQGIAVRTGDWSIQGLDGHDHLTASMQDYAINLALSGSKAPALHNGNGLIYGLGSFSYYYSRTHMDLSGTLIDHNQTLKVTGLAWMDHQWGDFLTLGGVGWDWYSLQLHNNTEMILYFIRDASGKVVSTYVGYIDATGKYTIIPATSLHSTLLDKWTSPATGIVYPSGWQLDINDPQLKASLTVIPQLKNQELVTTATTGNVYWEGAVSIQGQSNGQPIDGQGYVELTGYTK